MDEHPLRQAYEATDDRVGDRFKLVAPEDCGGGRMAASLPSRLRRTFANYPPRSNR
jgi:hypothetical protein